MKTVDFVIHVPRDMIPYLSNCELEHDFERNALIIYGFIQTGVLSHGRAAEILGVKKWDLIEFYNSKGLPYLDQNKEELLADLAADEYRFDTDEVFIIKVGDIVLLTSDPSLAGDLELSVSCLTDLSRPGGVSDSEICCKLEEAERGAEQTDRRLSAGGVMKAMKETIHE